MTHYSNEPKDCIFGKAYWFVYFTENIGKSTSKNVGKSLSSKCSQKRLHHTKQSPIDAPKPRSLFFLLVLNLKKI